MNVGNTAVKKLYYGDSLVNMTVENNGGGSITIDPTLDSGSSNPVANSAITNGIDSRLLNVYYGSANYAGEGVKILQKTYNNSSATGWGYLSSINNKSIIDNDYTKVNKFSLVETSAITTSITSSSTDSQVPSAKAVYDQIGDIETLLSNI